MQKNRKRGGQPHNTNAYVHGVYSALFKESERRLLDQVPLTDLSAEIELIRVTNARFLEALAASKGALDFESQLAALRAVNLSAHSIATLLRAQAANAAAARYSPEQLAALDRLASADPDDPTEALSDKDA